ncbi:uncharacterized protein LOC115131433 isoform X1 [Oncorhynchus nerka]|uniref:uncharacterized protein LOC115131433 isoform X1 n=2 Tax=Oncorhynchus nerka TaxID=8023 RepID=UPI001131A65D|nr:uncharacterized protein LOC115131433 isoform X1 [Oncorhynchus nerka]
MVNALFCVFCHFVSDMFEQLSSLSLTLQRNDLTLPQATSELRKTVTRLEALNLQTMLAQQQGDERRFQGITLNVNLKGFMDLTSPQLKRHMKAAINMGVDDLKARFGGLLKDEGVQTPVESFRVLNPDTWPEDQASLLTFGNDGVADLMRHFKEPIERSGCNMAAIQDEWQGLKILVSHKFKDKSYSGLWETMLTKDPYRHDYKNILELVQLMLVLPISAAQCERDFSAQNWITNSTRSCLGVSTTEDEDQPGGVFC